MKNYEFITNTLFHCRTTVYILFSPFSLLITFFPMKVKKKSDCLYPQYLDVFS